MAWWNQDVVLHGNDPYNILEQNIGFNPQAVIVDNYTDYWLYLPDAGAYIPPNWYQAIRPLFHANSARVYLQNPILTTQGPKRPTVLGASLGQFFTAMFTDEALQYASGQQSANKAGFVAFGYDQFVNKAVLTAPNQTNIGPGANTGKWGFWIKADPGNTDNVFISNFNGILGVPLQPGDSIFVEIDTAYDIVLAEPGSGTQVVEVMGSNSILTQLT